MNGYHLNFLEPDTAVFGRTGGNALQLKLSSGQTYPHVRVFCSYPLSENNKYISVRDGSDEDMKEIGIIRDLSKFPEGTRKIIEAKLAERYFRPVIRKVISLKENGDRLTWEIETGSGTRKFTVRDPFEHIRLYPQRKLIIYDTYDCRYEISDYTLLDEKTLETLSHHISL